MVSRRSIYTILRVSVLSFKNMPISKTVVNYQTIVLRKILGAQTSSAIKESELGVENITDLYNRLSLKK